MNTKNPLQDEWEHCSPGELSGLVQRLQSRERKRQWAAAAAAAAVLLCAVTAGYFAFDGLRGVGRPVAGHMRCKDCRLVAEEFLAGRLQQTDPQRAGQVVRHLEECSSCRTHFASLKARRTTDALPTGSHRPAFVTAETHHDVSRAWVLDDNALEP